MSRQGAEPHRYRFSPPGNADERLRGVAEPLVVTRPIRPDSPDPYYFRVPAVRPAWTWRWKDRYTTSTGSMATTIPANSAG